MRSTYASVDWITGFACDGTNLTPNSEIYFYRYYVETHTNKV